MPLKGQELHFANQIDGLLDRVGKIERYLGGRWRVADGVKCYHLCGLTSSPQGWHCSDCDEYFTIRSAGEQT